MRRKKKVFHKYHQQAQEKGKNVKLRYNFHTINSRKLFYEDYSISAVDILQIQKIKETPQKCFTSRSSDQETVQAENTSHPCTPRIPQLNQWLYTPERNK